MLETTDPTTEDLIANVNQARNEIFEVVNMLGERRKDYVDNGELQPLQEHEIHMAVEAAYKAADEAATSTRILHRNLMTLLGYESVTRCPNRCDGETICSYCPS